MTAGHRPWWESGEGGEASRSGSPRFLQRCLPEGSFLLCLLLLVSLLLCLDGLGGKLLEDRPERSAWVQLEAPGIGSRWFRSRPGEPLIRLLDREAVTLSGGPPSPGCLATVLGPATRIRVTAAAPGGEADGCTSTPLPEGTRYMMGMPMAINRATEDDLTLIRGVGPSLAGKIIAVRDARENGISGWNQVSEIRGIGPSLLQRIRASCVLEENRDG